MSHKANCISVAKERLQALQLENIYSQQTFEHYYRKNKGSQGNAFSIGLNAADLMIFEHPTTKNFLNQTTF